MPWLKGIRDGSQIYLIILTKTNTPAGAEVFIHTLYIGFI
jgi:hypothetical protein